MHQSKFYKIFQGIGRKNTKSGFWKSWIWKFAAWSFSWVGNIERQGKGTLSIVWTKFVNVFHISFSSSLVYVTNIVLGTLVRMTLDIPNFELRRRSYFFLTISFLMSAMFTFCTWHPRELYVFSGYCRNLIYIIWFNDAYNVFQRLLEKINDMEKEKEDITNKFQEQIVSLENEYEVSAQWKWNYSAGFGLLVFFEALFIAHLVKSIKDKQVYNTLIDKLCNMLCEPPVCVNTTPL